MDDPVPWVPPPAPPELRFPEPAVPGAPPPPLPGADQQRAPLPPAERTVAPKDDSWSAPSPYVDPALTADPRDAVRWCSRIDVTVEPGWAPVTLLRIEAPMRHVEVPSLAFVDEMSLALTALRAPEAALPDAPAGTPLLSRLRMLHERFVPQSIRYPLDAQWHELGGVPAVLDRLGVGQQTAASAFSLAAELGDGSGLVVLGYGPIDRHATLGQVAIPLAAMAEPTDTGIRWVLPRQWSGREELQLVSETIIARAHLEPLLAGWGLPEWTDAVFARTPFLRDLRPLGDREVRVPGVDLARLVRFDWQPSGRGRMLTTVVTGVTGDHGFSFVIEVPFESGSAFRTTDPDAVLAMLSVRPGAAPATSFGGEPGSSGTASVAAHTRVDVSPPRSDGGEYGDAERSFLAGVDRAVIAAVDAAAEAWRVAVTDEATYDRAEASADAAALAGTTAELIKQGNAWLVLERLADWAAGALPLLPETCETSGSTYRSLLLGHDVQPVETLMTAAVGSREAPSNIVARWVDVIDSGSSPTDALWATAFLITDAFASEWQRHEDEQGSLSAVLDQIHRRIPLATDVTWDASVPSMRVPQALRYRFRAFFDGGSGVLLWADSPAALRRWDYDVDQYALPVSKALADTIDDLVRRYDDASEDLRMVPPRPFTDDERRAFVAAYFATIDELRWALGPAYEIREQSGFTRS